MFGLFAECNSEQCEFALRLAASGKDMASNMFSLDFPLANAAGSKRQQAAAGMQEARAADSAEATDIFG